MIKPSTPRPKRAKSAGSGTSVPPEEEPVLPPLEEPVLPVEEEVVLPVLPVEVDVLLVVDPPNDEEPPEVELVVLEVVDPPEVELVVPPEVELVVLDVVDPPDVLDVVPPDVLPPEVEVEPPDVLPPEVEVLPPDVEPPDVDVDPPDVEPLDEDVDPPDVLLVVEPPLDDDEDVLLLWSQCLLWLCFLAHHLPPLLEPYVACAGVAMASAKTDAAKSFADLPIINFPVHFTLIAEMQ
jgi:hypothetical protein